MGMVLIGCLWGQGWIGSKGCEALGWLCSLIAARLVRGTRVTV
jgi:hypothetical protein